MQSNIGKREKEYSKLHPQRNVAVAGLVDDEGKILLMRTRALPDKWQPVGGGVKKDETPEQTIIREVKEELSIDIDPRYSVFNSSQAYDFGDGTVYFYTIPVERSLIELISIKASEVLEARWVPVDEFKDLSYYPATKKYLDAYKIFLNKNRQTNAV